MECRGGRGSNYSDVRQTLLEQLPRRHLREGHRHGFVSHHEGIDEHPDRRPSTVANILSSVFPTLNICQHNCLLGQHAHCEALQRFIA